MRRGQAWAAGAALLVAAWLVTLVTPPADAELAPFAVTGDLGERVVARALTATVSHPRLAQRVTAGGWSAEGRWLVVDLELEATREEAGTRVGSATLQIGERTFRASERPASIAETGLHAGIPQLGSIAFELPGDLDRIGDAVLRLAEDEDTRMDALIEVHLDGDDVAVVAGTALRPTGWAP